MTFLVLILRCCFFLFFYRFDGLYEVRMPGFATRMFLSAIMFHQLRIFHSVLEQCLCRRKIAFVVQTVSQPQAIVISNMICPLIRCTPFIRVLRRRRGHARTATSDFPASALVPPARVEIHCLCLGVLVFPSVLLILAEIFSHKLLIICSRRGTLGSVCSFLRSFS